MVYPRVGGATLAGGSFPWEYHGLSPRGRGNHFTARSSLSWSRSIPAWAGQPWTESLLDRPGRVYPRVGGATPFLGFGAILGQGLSPRGRGNPQGEHGRSAGFGSIPAWAGQPRRVYLPPFFPPVYPRVGGATQVIEAAIDRVEGLSPRGRGNLVQDRRRRESLGSIPAWAGQPAASWSSWRAAPVYPRVGGATLSSRVFTDAQYGLSPRGRGNPDVRVRGRKQDGSIPAWAGQPPMRTMVWVKYGVYPRVGGATAAGQPVAVPRLGLSPRGRGNRVPLECGFRGRRSIPAWAGQPSSMALPP